ncbi:hypothetical protein Purlil1_13644 [Purpureocillium lilacinum]|uniref:Reverse transcriptase domain-containing protein n=1 Tax=Purpureocillium lilacinum TaxID=33203 RepID=A0ABR0BDI8_PURLI|nr:hypothetical protein Purlil1_13644 [Purpureocillium lilacinum]
MHHCRRHTWQVGPSHGHGSRIAAWATENDLPLLNPPDTRTNAHGNTIDLAFSNIALAQATVEDHLATSSDHFTLSISLPALTPAKLPKGKILLATEDELKRYAENIEAGTATIPTAASTLDDLDVLPNAIIDLIQATARAAGRQSQRQPRGAPWWNEECIAAVVELRCEGKDIFKVTRWLKSPGVFRPPPLQVGETIVETQTGKADALRQATLERRTAADDRSLDTRNTSPGADNIRIGALPKRPAADLVAALIHDIEVALSRGMVATLISMDAQGTFDTVMRNMLILRLRQQGRPLNLVKWAASFMQDRSAAVRFQDITTPPSPLECGLAQGSPASPILFALYIAPIYRLGNSGGRFGYADDTAMLRVGCLLEETATLASRDMRELLTWGTSNGVTFDPDKTEIMHFSRKKDPARPSIFQDDIEIVPADSIRWLGLWLDRKLSFKTHVDDPVDMNHDLRTSESTPKYTLPTTEVQTWDGRPCNATHFMVDGLNGKGYIDARSGGWSDQLSCRIARPTTKHFVSPARRPDNPSHAG